MLRMTAPTDLQGWPLKFVQHTTDATCISPSPEGPPCSCPLHFPHLLSLIFVIGIPNRCCILQCLICNFLRLPRCEVQIAPKKTYCLRLALTLISEIRRPLSRLSVILDLPLCKAVHIIWQPMGDFTVHNHQQKDEQMT